ncbi:hypothetical protein [Litorihabitans aurantiacus]|uniref:Uncharacterized protein n=1 Tax=Litorihabitans aurantiacus TaxID=1930061 RepID=A0AA37XCY9_9MICO|nr:hypothetical protein [Litorihabitans aurantiacus]GMA30796.1 hypothetical protein GCM10025875_07880 [Litorihabitans aurantiacus]
MSSGPRDVVAALYELPPEEFVAARAREVAALRASGDEVGAARLRKVAKPTVAACWVNTLHRHWPDELEQLLALGADLRAATLARDRAELMRLDRARRLRADGLVSLLWHHGEEQAASGLRPPSNETLTRVLETLTAAVMDPEVADVVRAGTCARTVVHEGFTLVTALMAVDERPAGPTVTLLPAPDGDPDGDSDDDTAEDTSPRAPS